MNWLAYVRSGLLIEFWFVFFTIATPQQGIDLLPVGTTAILVVEPQVNSTEGGATFVGIMDTRSPGVARRRSLSGNTIPDILSSQTCMTVPAVKYGQDTDKNTQECGSTTLTPSSGRVEVCCGAEIGHVVGCNGM